MLRSLGLLLALVAASAGLGFLVSWPLWLFATDQRKAYTIFVLLVCAAGVIAVIVRKLRMGRSRHSEMPRRAPFVTGLLVIAWLIVLFLGLYLMVILLAKSLFGYAIPLVVELVLLLGFLASHIQRKNNPG